MPYRHLVDEICAHRRAATAMVPIRLIDNLEFNDADRPLQASHGWVSSPDDSRLPPEYATAPYDFRDLPGFVFPVPTGHRRYRVRVLYRASGDSRTRLKVRIGGIESDSEDLTAAATTAWSDEFVIDQPDAADQYGRGYLIIDTNRIDYDAANDLQNSIFTPIGVCVIAEGGVFEPMPDRTARSIGRPMLATGPRGIEQAMWRMYRDRRRLYACQPDDSSSRYPDAGIGLSRNETHVSAPAAGETRRALGILVERRPDTAGIQVRLWGARRRRRNGEALTGPLEDRVRAEWLTIDGTLADTATTRPDLPTHRLSPVGATSYAPAESSSIRYEQDIGATPLYCGDATAKGAQEGLPLFGFELAWPDDVDEGDLIGLEVSIPDDVGGVWHASASEIYELDPPERPVDMATASSGANIPERWQPVSIPAARIYPRYPIRGGAPPPGATHVVSMRALVANDRRLRATRCPVILSRYNSLGWYRVDNTQATGTLVLFDGVPFRTLVESSGTLNVAVWTDATVTVTVEAIPVSGTTQSVTLVASGSGAVETTGTITSLVDETWYRLKVTATGPGTAGFRVYGILVTEADQTSVS